MTQLQYLNLDPEVKDRLNRKSKVIFNAKHRWRKIENRLNCGVEFLEAQLDKQLALMDKMREVKIKLKSEQNNVKELNRSNVRRNERRSKNSSSR